MQDEPLQITVLDHDTYSANDAIGKVYIDIDPLLCSEAATVISGWLPIYDTIHGTLPSHTHLHTPVTNTHTPTHTHTPVTNTHTHQSQTHTHTHHTPYTSSALICVPCVP